MKQEHLHDREAIVLLSETLQAIHKGGGHDKEERKDHRSARPLVHDVGTNEVDTSPDASTEEGSEQAAESNSSNNANTVDVGLVLGKTTNETLVRAKVYTVQRFKDDT